MIPLQDQRRLAALAQMDWSLIQDIQSPNMFLGGALIISAIAQAHTTGISVYHAIIILNLNLMIATNTFFTVHGIFLWWFDDNTAFLSYDTIKFVTYFCHLHLTSGFGLWLFANITHFDHTGTDCVGSTVFYAFGKHVHVQHLAVRIISLYLYSVLSIPIINILWLFVVYVALAIVPIIPIVILLFLIMVAFLIIFFVGAIILCLRRTFQRDMATFLRCLATQSLSFASATIAHKFIGLTLLILIFLILLGPLFLMMTFTELTIQANNVSSGEGDWNFGQTLALTLAIPPVWKAMRVIWRLANYLRGQGSRWSDWVANVFVQFAQELFEDAMVTDVTLSPM